MEELILGCNHKTLVQLVCLVGGKGMNVWILKGKIVYNKVDHGHDLGKVWQMIEVLEENSGGSAAGMS